MMHGQKNIKLLPVIIKSSE